MSDMAQSAETKNLLLADDLQEGHIIEFSSVPEKRKNKTYKKGRLCSRQVALGITLVTLLWLFLIFIGFGLDFLSGAFKVCNSTLHDETDLKPEKPQSTEKVSSFDVSLSEKLTAEATSSATKADKETDYPNLDSFEPVDRKQPVVAYRDDNAALAYSLLNAMKRLFDNVMVRYAPDPDYLIWGGEEYTYGGEPFVPRYPELEAFWPRFASDGLLADTDYRKPKKPKHPGRGHKHHHKEMRKPLREQHPVDGSEEAFPRFPYEGILSPAANMSFAKDSSFKSSDANASHTYDYGTHTDSFLRSLQPNNTQHQTVRPLSHAPALVWNGATDPPIARERFARAVPAVNGKVKRNSVKKTLNDQKNDYKMNYAAKLERSGWNEEDTADLLVYNLDRKKRAIPYAHEADQRMTSMENIALLKQRHEKLKKAAEAAAKHRARSEQAQKDQVLMQEMFDNLEEGNSLRRKKRSINEDDTAAASQQFQDDDYNTDDSNNAEQFQVPGQLRSEPYRSDSFSKKRKEKKAVQFDSDDLTKKQHDNSKAQWPGQLVDRFKNIVDEEKDGIQLDEEVNDDTQMDSQDESFQNAEQLDNAEDEDTEQLSSGQAEMDDESDDSEDMNEVETEAEAAAEEDDTENAENVLLDIATEEERHQMQFIDTSKKETSQSAYHPEMDFDNSDAVEKKEKQRSDKTTSKDDEAVANELAKLFDQPPSETRKVKSVRKVFPQEDINFLKEVVLGPFLPPAMAITERRPLRYPKQSDVKILSSRTNNRPVQFGGSSADASSSEPNVKNFLTLNINIGPDAMIRLNQNNNDAEEDDDLVSTQHDKGIKVNMLRSGKTQKGLMASDVNSKQKKRKTKIETVVKKEDTVNTKEDAEDDDEEDEDEEIAEKDADSDVHNEKSSPGRPKKPESLLQQNAVLEQERKQRKRASTFEFDAAYPLSRPGYGQNNRRNQGFSPERPGEVVAIKLGSINGDGSDRRRHS
ncbi:uncharacterized protein LOC129586720 isoform X2 [Paramacrobiotus metropolitanus]|uniref:uncharacterized protein LOC129586720 isoform X2 n=1 Tax=Paramacrobiotus metropolitanus TaxID=2943436 RepID=UPI0024465BD4|nr:uncharacterized protein LOC129586720 isoform X2 [Paramacrobiotus metropolitanus]